jgi:hypothetical protein
MEPLSDWKRNLVLKYQFTGALLMLIPAVWERDLLVFVSLLAFLQAAPLRMVMFASRRDPPAPRIRRIERGPWTIRFEYHHGRMKLTGIRHVHHATSSYAAFRSRDITLHKAFGFLLHRQALRTSRFTVVSF